MALTPSSAARPLPQEGEHDAPADPGWDEAWEAELDRRIADVREGRVQLIPAEQVFAELDEKLKAHRAARLAAKR